LPNHLEMVKKYLFQDSSIDAGVRAKIL